MSGRPTSPPSRLPDGFQVELGPDVRRSDGGRTLFGGSPARILYLKPRARALLAGDALTVADESSARLARLLLDSGVANPAANRPEYDAADVTVVVPVKDRPLSLARLLDELPPGMPAVVVDDGSADPGQTASVAGRRGVRLLRHPVSRGPAAARNAGLRAVRTPLVAFVDSDVVPRPGWLEPLLGVLSDPAVGIVAPRIAALEAAGGGAIARYEAARSSLDLGPRPALVAPRGRVAYVPSACLVGRVTAFAEGFDESMHVGEDVDLVWRTIAAGWQVRYEPASVVEHEHRVSARGWLLRKAFYGTSAAPLSQRHRGAVAPVVVSPWTAAVVAVVLTQRRWSLPLAAVVTGGATWWLSRRLTGSRTPLRAAARLAPYGVVSALWQCGAAMTRHWWPVSLVAMVFSRRARRAVLAAAIVDGVADWRRTKPRLDPVRYVALRRADDLAYGAGLWFGAVKHRTTGPLRPALGRRLSP